MVKRDFKLMDPIARAKELLATVRHAAMATVNEDGSPHNTPYFFMIDDELAHLYWGSHPDSQHSRNIARTGQLFVVLFDATERGGLYIRANNGHVTEGDEFTTALMVHNNMRKRAGKLPLKPEYYHESPQKIYKADIQAMWVNVAERGANGLIVRDVRREITAHELLA